MNHPGCHDRQTDQNRNTEREVDDIQDRFRTTHEATYSFLRAQEISGKRLTRKNREAV